jgi:hypothetical protein
MKIKPGVVLHKYVPFKSGLHKVTVIEKRALKEGDFALSNSDLQMVFQRKGGAYISVARARYQYWVVEIGEPVNG